MCIRDSGVTEVFTLVSGEVNLDIDAGLIDVEAPTFTVPADITIACGDEIPTPDVAVADNCSTGLVAEFADVEDFDMCGGTITRTWTATDDCGNVTEQIQIITVEPAAEPTIDVPAIADVTCDEAASFTAPDATFSNGATGTCEISGTVPGVVDADFDECGGTITITWTVPSADNCDRPAIVESVTIDVAPAPDPVIDVPAIADVTSVSYTHLTLPTILLV